MLTTQRLVAAAVPAGEGGRTGERSSSYSLPGCRQVLRTQIFCSQLPQVDLLILVEDDNEHHIGWLTEPNKTSTLQSCKSCEQDSRGSIEEND